VNQAFRCFGVFSRRANVRTFSAAGACECPDPGLRNGYDGNGNKAEGKNAAASRLAK